MVTRGVRVLGVYLAIQTARGKGLWILGGCCRLITSLSLIAVLLHLGEKAPYSVGGLPPSDSIRLGPRITGAIPTV